MTLKGFIFLLAVTIVTVIVAGLLAERFAAPGFERTLVVAAVTALVVFPAGRFAERRGWVGGQLQVGNLKNEFTRKNKPGAPQAPVNKSSEGTR
jgi:hypothetical protein